MSADYYKNIEDALRSVTPDILVRTNLFHILRIDESSYEGIKEKAPYKFDFFEIVVSSAKNSIFSIGEDRFVNPGQNISFVGPNQLLSWRSEASKSSGITFVIYFEPELLGLDTNSVSIYKSFPFFNINTIPFYKLNDEQLKVFFDLAENMNDEFNNFDEHSLEMIKSYLNIFLHKAKKLLKPESLKNKRFDRKHEITFNFENLVKGSKNKRIPISDYASELNVSSVYLSECIKHTTGKTAKKVIDEYLILEAKSLLVQSNKTISEISFDLGFDDPSNFRKYFKTLTGISPKGFRNKT